MGIAAEELGAFAGLLRHYREAASLTQEELAERSGLTSRAISDMERGRTTRPYLSSVRLLADALDLSGQDRVQLTAAARARPRPDRPDEQAPQPAGRHGPAWRRHNAAVGYYWQAFGVFGDLDRRGDQARVLTNLGDAELAFGATQAAVDAWQRAIAIFDELRHPGAELARGKLRDLGWPEAADRARRRTATTRRAPDPAPSGGARQRPR